MTERYPDDASLLALTADNETGVEYIPTGLSPYHLEFRRLVQRLIIATRRANDLRVYQDGDLTVGVRAGRCTVGGAVQNYAGATGITLSADATHYVWLDHAGVLQASTSAMPTAPTAFVPLAEVVVGATAIESITDRRGEALLNVTTPETLGIDATPEEISRALDGITAAVDAAALSSLCDGPTSTADALHRHTQFFQDVAGEARLSLINDSADAAATVGLRLSVPNQLAHDTFFVVDPAHGFLAQRYDTDTYQLVGAVHAQHRHAGTLGASQSGVLVGVAPIDGTVVDVIFSTGANIQSTNPDDQVSTTLYVNGAAATTTAPALASGDGAGFRCTGQGDGTAAVIATGGDETVTRGDVLTLDLNRTAAGTVSSEATDVVVLIVIRAARPE